MRRIGGFLVATLVRGIVFLLPVTLVAVLARETYRALVAMTQPLAAWLPFGRVFGVLMEDLLAIAMILAVFLLAGLFVGTRRGRSLSDRLERMILYRVPGYLLVRGAAGGMPGLKLGSEFAPVLVRLDDAWIFALLVERHDWGFCTVFAPDSPSPTSGGVMLVETDRVRPLESNVLGLLGCLTRSGVGAGKLAATILAPSSSSSSSPPPSSPSPAPGDPAPPRDAPG